MYTNGVMKLERLAVWLAVALLAVSYVASNPEDSASPIVSTPAAAPATPASGPAAAGTARPSDSPAPAKPAAEPAGRKSNQSSKRGCGSAAILRGDVRLCNLYVCDRQSRWTDAQKKTCQQRMDAAVQFICGQAKRYKEDVSFEQETLKDFTYDGVIPTDMFANPGWIENCVRGCGFDSANALVKSVQERCKCSGTLLVVHVNKKATSYNLTYSEGVHASFKAERVVMFTNYKDGRPTCAASYTHEILHSFGAGELYFPFDNNPKRKQVAAKFFPNDVMYRVDYDLKKLSIDDYTAYRVGWIETLDPQYKLFED